MESLKGQTVLITGATSGIGLACASVFFNAGCNLILIARRQERLRQIKQSFEGEPHRKIECIQLDITNTDDAKRKLSDSIPLIDIAINNAGVVTTDKPIQNISAYDIDSMIDTNFTALVHLTNIILPSMIEKESGQIVNIGSIAAEFCYPGGNVYAATKHAVKAFTRSLRMDLLGTPIKVSQVNPGATRTEISEIRWNKKKADEYYDSFDPLDPIDVAEAVMFCCTRKKNTNIDSLTITPLEQMESRIKPITLEKAQHDV